MPEIPFATAEHAWTLDENKRDTADRALLTRHVRHHGDAVAVVVARDELTAEKAVQLVSTVVAKRYPLSPRQTGAGRRRCAIHNGGNLLKQSDVDG